MPRYIVKTPARSTECNEFVHKLVKELRSPGKAVQPLIIEEPVPATKSRHVHVIWDAWKDLTGDQRAEIISDAYKQAEGEQAAAEITVASGLTAEEAQALGMLPYKVESVRKSTDRVSLDEYRQAYETEKKNTVLGAKAKELRYATLEEADRAYERLTKQLPGSYWAVIQEVPVAS